MANQNIPQDLSLLHDIHTPPSISWWPLAPGWYLLVGGLVCVILLTLFFYRRYYVHGQAKRQALRELDIIEKQYDQDNNSQNCSACLSKLLRRVALVYYPRTDIAGLQGEAWLLFLNKSAAGVNFNAVRTQLLELPWKPSYGQPVKPFITICRQWIIKQRKPCSN